MKRLRILALVSRSGALVSRSGAALAMALAPLALAGCIIPVGGAVVGDLRVTWSFGGVQRCAEVGVENVVIQLIEKGLEGKGGAKAFGQTAECIAGSMVIPDVVAGTYVMTAVGTGEVAVFDNGEGVIIEVLPNTLTEASAPLALANGEVVSRIEFQYNFGGEAVCSAAGVTNVLAQVIDDNGVAIAGSNTDCITGLATVEGIRVGEHTLKVEAVDAEGTVRYATAKALLGLQAGETLRLDPLSLNAAIVDVTVNFNFDGQSCAEAGVDNVAVQLTVFDNGEGNDPERPNTNLADDRNLVVAAQNVPCIDGRATFTSMPVGDYQVNIDGIDGNGEVLFNAIALPLVLDGVDENPNDRLAIDDVDITLTAKRSTVTIPFRLAGGTCAELGVQNVDIQVTQNGQTIGTTVACVAGNSGPLIVAEGAAVIRIDALIGDEVSFQVSSDDASIAVPAGESIADVVVLEPVRTTLAVSWDFTLITNSITGVATRSPPTSSCTEAGVDTVVVRVFIDGVLEVAEAVDCDAGTVDIPGIPSGPDARVKVEIDGIREQEGEVPFKINAADPRVPGFAISGPRMVQRFTLEPQLAELLIVWRGVCGDVGAATVDIQITAELSGGIGGINSGINVPCAQGSQTVVLPRSSVGSILEVSLRGVGGQGEPVGIRDVFPAPPPEDPEPVFVAPAGVTTIAFLGPRLP